MPPLPPPAPTPARSNALRLIFSGRRLLLALGVLGFIGHQVAEALVPVIIGVVIDRAISPGDAGALAFWLAVLAALFGGLLLSWRLGELVSVRVSEAGGRAVRRSLVSRILSRSGFAHPRTPGELLSIAGSDTERAAGATWVLGAAAAQLAAVLTAAVSLLLISVPLGLLVLVATPALVLLLHFVTGPLERRREAEQDAAAAASSTAADLLTGLRAVTGLRAEDAAAARFAEVNRRSLVAARRAISTETAYTVASMAGSALLLAGIAAAAASSAAAGRISVGELVAVLGLAQFLHWPVRGLAFVGAELASVRASAKRVDAVLAAAPAPTAVEAPAADPARTRARPLPGAAPEPTAAPAAEPAAESRRTVEVVFEHVRTPHAGPFSATLPAGAHVALRFADPRGAREVQEALAGLRRLEEGRILIGGIDAADPAARSLASAPPHHSAVFAGTLRDNVELHRRAPEDALPTAARTAVLDDVLDAGRGGWELAVGERGLTLSGGQRQRVALARGLARESPVLALHDPTSAVDSVTEEVIAQRLGAHRRGRTTILIDPGGALAHRCDAVFDVPAPGDTALAEPASDGSREVPA